MQMRTKQECIANEWWRKVCLETASDLELTEGVGQDIGECLAQIRSPNTQD